MAEAAIDEARRGAPSKPRLLAISSAGGHWTQLQRLRPAFEGFEVVYASTYDLYADDCVGHRFYRVPNPSRFNKLAFIPLLAAAVRIVLAERPDAILTTGAAPPLAFLLIGRFIGARTLWIDSIANSERLSSSGRLARRLAHKVVSQWPDVAAREGVECWGRVL